MRLKYHQATYDLLTQKPIDRQKGVKQFDDYIESRLQKKAKCGLDIEADRAKLSEEWAGITAWTTLDLYQRPVRFSEANIQKLDALEQKYSVKLPEALREWYSLDIMPEIMSVDGRGFMAIEEMKPVSQLGASWLKHVRDDLWYFLNSEYIDQGGEYLVCSLGAGDNPPVLAEYRNELHELAATFSDFIYMHMWRWYSRFMFDYGFSIAYVSELKSLGATPEFYIPLNQLRQHYNEVKSSWLTYFYDDHSRIQVRPLIENKEIMAGGEFMADSMEGLKKLLTMLWGDRPPVFRIRVWEKEVGEWIKGLQRERLRAQLHTYADWVKEPELARSLGGYLPNLSTDMAQQLEWLIENGEAEEHPDNREDRKSERQFRVKR